MSKVYPINVVALDLVEWLRVGCCDGDMLKVINTPSGVALYNERTHVLYLAGASEETDDAPVLR